MKKLALVARILLGSAFLVFGLNGFLNFLPMQPHPGPAGAFLGALGASGYMFPLIKGTEVLAGALILSGAFVPLALLLLAPVMVNIVAFHAFLDPANLAVPLVLVAAGLILAWSHREAYAPLFVRRAAAPSKTGNQSSPAFTLDTSRA